jgi:hypothetical protein
MVLQLGARPKSTWLDMVICYLAWLKLGQDYPVLACALGDITTIQLENNINYIRLILFQVLHEKWLLSPSRLKPLVDSPFLHVEIIINNHTTQYYHLKVLFDKAKIYYDRKNHIYGLKSEVVVSATPSYYCIFVGDHTPGFVYNFKIIKRKYHCYFEYLLKLLFETFQLFIDQAFRFEVVLVDKGYIALDHSIPNMKCVTPIRNP